uniref:1-acyl-sn-glycerol-3-phosphate acyltransferase epsilon n=1 Tax=Phallusia mammillata TaxID=59560 RepID=A0A6F9D5V6_9ASCI|nr:1-acyl-sn-glycerol-3-phosphate acyltransferase epsilon [Phallusia mammillata]
MTNVILDGLKILFSTFAIILLAISTVPYVILLLCWSVISTPLPATWFHTVEDGLWGWYQRMVVFFFEHYAGVEIHIDGTIPSTKENVLVLSNHQCMVDWIVADFLAVRQNMTGNMRFVFKNSLKYYPIYGFSFGIHGGVFVRRDGFYNNHNMQRVLDTLKQRKADLYFLLYPEGTRFTPHKKSLLDKSQSFAVKSGLEPLNQVLTPRVKAFDCTLNSLQTYIHAIYDITIVYDTRKEEYDGYRPQSPHALQFLFGRCKKVYIKFERIPIKDVLSQISACGDDVADDQASAPMKWLHNRFAIKDKLLEEFFSKSGRSISNSGSEGNSNQAKRWRRSRLPYSATLPSTISFILIHAVILYFPFGRYIYIATSTIGVLLMSVYAHFCF